MQSPLVTTQSEFDRLCDEIAAAGIVAFDTEFVSESTYRPELCLLQLATPTRSAIVDPFAVPDLDRWWDLMLDDRTTIVVHGGREEVRFCLTYTGQPPRLLKDIQIAEGFRSRSFPIGYSALVKRVVGREAHGRETRTDWRRRPLLDSQIRYAIEDVKHVLEIWERQRQSLTSLGRLSWAEAEFEQLIAELELERSPESWRRLSGLPRLTRRELAIARAIHRWREAEGEQKDRPVRKVLRDDLVIELARRQPKTLEDLVATRDFSRPEYRRVAPELLQLVQQARQLPDDQCPERLPDPNDDQSHDEHVLGQFLGLALANRCAEQNVAMSLVGKSADLRALVRWHVYKERHGLTPRLLTGWRTEVCGDLLTRVLDGQIAIRVGDPHADIPLIFEQRKS